MSYSFIPAELAVAPNPFGMTSTLKLTTIPVDAYTCFEVWMPIGDSVLLAEEAKLLIGDRARIEAICEKMTWLLGATPIRKEPQAAPEVLYSWSEVLVALKQDGLYFDAINVIHLPQVLYPNSNEDEDFSAWTFNPATWHISFLLLQPVANGYKPKALPFSLLLSLGQPLTKTSLSPASHAVE